MNILAIETSCDETSISIVRDGRHIVTNVIASQIDLHQRYGGVVPELASRQHIVTIIPVLAEALNRAGMTWVNLDAIAVTRGPGLSPALLVGVNAAKAIAFARSKPLVVVNHIEGHVYSNWLIPENLTPDDPIAPEPRFPALCLVVSGGHTELILMTGHGQYRLLGKTIDDAAGEAFDKAARILGLGYPGGPAIQRAAAGGDPNRFQFPRAWLKGTNDFSFSGLKTALLRKVQSFGFETTKPAPWQTTQIPEHHASPSNQPADIVERTVAKLPLATVHLVYLSTFSAGENAVNVPETSPSIPSPPPVKPAHVVIPSVEHDHDESASTSTREPLPIADLAASFQEAVVDTLVQKTVAAAAEFGAREVLVAGGVAANALLRERLGERLRIPYRYPPLVLCTDNAAMIAAAAYFRYAESVQYDFAFDIEPNARFV